MHSVEDDGGLPGYQFVFFRRLARVRVASLIGCHVWIGEVVLSSQSRCGDMT